MSDQYTRITCGGSPLNQSDPVVGLLFGSYDQNESTLQITDAEDIPVDRSDAAKNQVSLHQAVFPLHIVVGWYRVTNSDSLRDEDLTLTNDLIAHYQSEESITNNGPFVFGLLQLNSEKDELPLSLFKSDNRVFLNIPWKLETAKMEQVAVERVVREHPTHGAESSVFVQHTKTIQDSLSAVQDRLQVLIKFVEDTKAQIIPTNHALLRDVNSLLLQLGPIGAIEIQPKDGTLEQIAIFAKTVDAIQSYTEKFRIVHEASVSRASQARGRF